MKVHKTKTGELKPCKATVKACPFGEHFDVSQKEMNDFNDRVYEKAGQDDERFLTLSAYNLFYDSKEAKAERIIKDVLKHTLEQTDFTYYKPHGQSIFNPFRLSGKYYLNSQIDQAEFTESFGKLVKH